MAVSFIGGGHRSSRRKLPTCRWFSENTLLSIINYYDSNNVWFFWGVLEHVDDVRAIVQKAVKDLAIDQSLKTYDEIWTSKLFELRLHTRVRTEQELMTVPVSIVDYMIILM